MNILNGETPIVDLIEDADAEAAIYGAVLMHATRVLGNDVMKALTSPMGDVMNHEGIVMRDEKLFGPNPVKITGEFIVGNLGGGFGQVTEEEGDVNVDLDVIDNEDADPVGQNAGVEKIALIPGAFKPPHRGHLGMVEEYAQRADKVVVLMSSPLKSGRKLPNGREITAEDSKKIWETLVSHLPNVEVQISPHASPITATYDFVGKDGPLQPGTEVILGVCNKGSDVERFSQAEKYMKDGVVLMPVRQCAIDPISHSTYYMDILGQSPLKDQMPSMSASGKDPRDFHASDMRYLLGQAESDEEAVELLEDFTGEDNIFDVLAILGLNTGLNELAGGNAMSAGAVAGAVGAQGGPWKRGNLDQENEEEKKRSKLKKENTDLSMVDEIMRLFTERGIVR